MIPDRDDADPDGDTIDIALVRARSSARGGDRVGSLLFNFGGPGGSGVATLPAFGEDYAELGHCIHCGEHTNNFINCLNEDTCRRQALVCESCAAQPATAHCGRPDCAEVAAGA